jgi:hypothetical protein
MPEDLYSCSSKPSWTPKWHHFQRLRMKGIRELMLGHHVTLPEVRNSVRDCAEAVEQILLHIAREEAKNDA